MRTAARIAEFRFFLSPLFLISVVVFSTLYFIFQAYSLNHVLLNQTLLGNFPFFYKLSLFYQVITGYFYLIPGKYFFLTILTMFLVGANLALLVVTFKKSRKLGEMKLVLGGSNLLAIVSSGCPSCGLTALSVLGPSTGAFSFLFHDPKIQFITLGVLLLSFFLNLRQAMKKTDLCQTI